MGRPSTVRRVATVPASVQPKISKTGARKRASARAANSGDSGAVADTTARSAGKATSAAARARRWIGVVTRTR